MTFVKINHGANLRLPLNTQNAERPSDSGDASGGLAPWSPTGLCSLDARWGLRPRPPLLDCALCLPWDPIKPCV